MMESTRCIESHKGGSCKLGASGNQVSTEDLKTREWKKDRVFTCDICSIKLSAYHILMKHKLQQHSNKKGRQSSEYICVECQVYFQTYNRLILHKRKCHQPTDRNKITESCSLQCNSNESNGSQQTSKQLDQSYSGSDKLRSSQQTSNELNAKDNSVDLLDGQVQSLNAKPDVQNPLSGEQEHVKFSPDSQMNLLPKDALKISQFPKDILGKTLLEDLRDINEMKGITQPDKSHGEASDASNFEVGTNLSSMNDEQLLMTKALTLYQKAVTSHSCKCLICQKRFNNKYKVRTHIKALHSNQVITCKFCEVKTFSSKMHIHYIRDHKDLVKALVEESNGKRLLIDELQPRYIRRINQNLCRSKKLRFPKTIKSCSVPVVLLKDIGHNKADGQFEIIPDVEGSPNKETCKGFPEDSGDMDECDKISTSSVETLCHSPGLNLPVIDMDAILYVEEDVLVTEKSVSIVLSKEIRPVSPTEQSVSSNSSTPCISPQKQRSTRVAVLKPFSDDVSNINKMKYESRDDHQSSALNNDQFLPVIAISSGSAFTDIILPFLEETLVKYRRFQLSSHFEEGYAACRWFQSLDSCNWTRIAVIKGPLNQMHSLKTFIEAALANAIPAENGFNCSVIEPILCTCALVSTSQIFISGDACVCCDCGIVVYGLQCLFKHLDQHRVSDAETFPHIRYLPLSSINSKGCLYLNIGKGKSDLAINKSDGAVEYSANTILTNLPEITTEPVEQELKRKARSPCNDSPGTDLSPSPKKAKYDNIVVDSSNSGSASVMENQCDTSTHSRLQIDAAHLTDDTNGRGSHITLNERSDTIQSTNKSQCEINLNTQSSPLEELQSTTTSDTVVSRLACKSTLTQQFNILKASSPDKSQSNVFKLQPMLKNLLTSSLPPEKAFEFANTSQTVEARNSTTQSVPSTEMEVDTIPKLDEEQKAKSNPITNEPSLSQYRLEDSVESLLKPFCCSLCNKYFLLQEMYEQHMETHHFRCPLCNVLLKDRIGRSLHMSSCHDLATCLACDEIGDDSQIQSHILQTHIQKDQTIFYCTICAKSKCLSQKLIDDHIKNHDVKKRLTCYICAEKLPSSKGAQFEHFLNHIGHPQRYKCHTCGKSYLEAWALRAHLKACHENFCVVCLYTCEDESEFINSHKHQCEPTAGIHLKVLEESLRPCRLCTSIVPLWNLRNHNNKEHKNHKLLCSKCGQRFLHHHQLRLHLKCHSRQSERFRACPACLDVLRISSLEEDFKVELCFHCKLKEREKACPSRNCFSLEVLNRDKF